MDHLLEADVALVTGAGQGNGEAIARGLARHGATVAVTDLQSDQAQAVADSIVAEGGKAKAWDLDVTNPEACQEVVGEISNDLGPISILVNNAGLIYRDTIDSEAFDSHWQHTLDVNLNGAKSMTLACLPGLRKTRGRIVNLGSILSFGAGAGSAAYCVSKAAIASMTKAFAIELAPDGVRVNALAPGIIATPMTADTRSNPEALNRLLARVPMGRVGETDELVGPVLFLVSPLSQYVTGAILPVDGGYLAG